MCLTEKNVKKFRNSYLKIIPKKVYYKGLLTIYSPSIIKFVSMRKFLSSFVLLILLSPLNYIMGNEISDKLQNMSVTVKTDKGTGSGTIFYSKDKMYVLTAGHVVCDSLEVNKGLCEVERTIFSKGKEIGSYTRKAKLVAISMPEEKGGIDLALLEVKGGKDERSGSVFLEDNILEVGDKIHHIGSLYGDITNSYITGTISRMDYNIPDFTDSTFNVANLNGRPGSSGGGVFLEKDGVFKYCGMVVRGDNGGCMLLKPVEVIKKWLKENNFNDVVDPEGVNEKVRVMPREDK